MVSGNNLTVRKQSDSCYVQILKHLLETLNESFQKVFIPPLGGEGGFSSLILHITGFPIPGGFMVLPQLPGIS